MEGRRGKRKTCETGREQHVTQNKDEGRRINKG
jgi:hypothetical protein